MEEGMYHGIADFIPNRYKVLHPCPDRMVPGTHVADFYCWRKKEWIYKQDCWVCLHNNNNSSVYHRKKFSKKMKRIEKTFKTKNYIKEKEKEKVNYRR